MGRLANFLYEYPDELLTVTGFVGGFGLATATVGPWGGVTAGLFAGLFTLLLAKMDPPEDPALGPHQ